MNISFLRLSLDLVSSVTKKLKYKDEVVAKNKSDNGYSYKRLISTILKSSLKQTWVIKLEKTEDANTQNYSYDIYIYLTSLKGGFLSKKSDR